MNKKHRILHMSDTHSLFPKLQTKFDFIVHTGDFFPDFFTQLNRSIEDQQISWLHDNMSRIRDWIEDKYFLFVGGNHDFVNPDTFEKILLENHINAINLSDKRIVHEGLSFYGFPYVPTINDCFNYEADESEMKALIKTMVKTINTSCVDIVAAHCAFQNVLDYGYGNQAMNEAFLSDIKKSRMPKAYLHGHIHSMTGVTIFNDVLVSNAATVQNIIEIIK